VDDDWTTVCPDPGQVKAVARELLALARDPRDVRTDSNGNEFRIPPYLSELYAAPAPVQEPAKPPAPKRARRSKTEDDE